MTREILAAGKPALFISQESVLLQFRGFMGSGPFSFSKGTGIKRMAQTGTARNMLNPLLANAYSKKVTLFIMGSLRKSIGAKNGDARIVIMGKRPRVIVSRRLKSILLMAWGEPQKPLGLPQCRQIRRHFLSYEDEKAVGCLCR